MFRSVCSIKSCEPTSSAGFPNFALLLSRVRAPDSPVPDECMGEQHRGERHHSKWWLDRQRSRIAERRGTNGPTIIRRALEGP
jgi:hypothetical protein